MSNGVAVKAGMLSLILFVAAAQISDASELKWPKKVSEKVAEAVRLKENEPVGALLAFSQILADAKNLKSANIAFLEAEIETLRGAVVPVIKEYYATSVAQRDLRGMAIAFRIAEKIGPGIAESDFSGTMKEILRSGDGLYRLWDVSNAVGRPIASPYTEEVPPSGQFSLGAETGHRLLRVTAIVANREGSDDQDYSLWALSDVKRLLARVATKEPGSTAVRWLDDSHIFVLGPDLEFYPCLIVVKYTGGRGLRSAVAFSRHAKIVPPRFLAAEESVEIDVLFAVPEGASDLRLLILGGYPIPIVMEESKPTKS